LKKITTGTIIYDVFAIDDPSNGCEKKIGSIKTKSAFTTSRWGDEKLFFRHNWMEDDLAENKKWVEYTPKWHFMNIGTGGETPERKCPFAHLWNKQ
jgi:hypothetical protein